MFLVDLTLEDAAGNLALDEALLETAEAAGEPREVLRLWEPAAPMVVIGRSSHAAAEVHLDFCRQRNIPVLRRTSGGAGIVTAPGCLMYSVVLSYERRPALRSLDEAHRFVLGTMASALRELGADVERRGTSDLATGAQKFSGNSVRCKRNAMLYHGTLLYDFPLDLISQCLAQPPRQPKYRQGRSHDAFVANLPLDGVQIRRALIEAWQANQAYGELPQERMQQLVAEKYSQDSWNYRL